jgi:hypothetical protein
MQKECQSLPDNGRGKRRNVQFTNGQIVALSQEAEKGVQSMAAFCHT